MTVETMVGVVVIAVALSAVIFLVFWSRQIIEHIHLRSPKTLREIKRETSNE